MAATRKPRNPVENQTILDIARRHFAEKGYAGARVDEIALEAGVNKATLYYRIGDKSELYEAVIGGAMDCALEDMRNAMQEISDPEQQLRVYILALAKHIDSHPCFPALIMREIASGAENITEPLLERMHELRSLLAQILARGVKQQRFRQLNPFLIYMQIIGSLMFYAAGAPVRQRMIEFKGDAYGIGASLSDAANELADIVLHAVYR